MRLLGANVGVAPGLVVLQLPGDRVDDGGVGEGQCSHDDH